VDGDKLGRKLGYPTANLKVTDEEKITPSNGIYAVYARLLEQNQATGSVLRTQHSVLNTHDSRLKGMMSIGFRPTVDGKKRVIEVNIFDFDQDIYRQTLRVYVKKYLRQEIKFDSLDDLVKQIDNDKIESLKVL
jgi:riboflavin kinase/FMN adenylyltransferase